MKTFLAALVAAGVLSAPVAEANDRNGDRHGGHVTIEKTVKTAPGQKVVIKKKRWDRGQKITSNERRHYVDQRDYKRYRLAKPRHDQRWVKVDDQFLLVNFATGLIVGLTAVR
ncbi:hypothetical protein F3Y30_15365 [Sinorhizobium sp. BG8]|nr:hypothetical protein F3Y30_15365 [Sinorhizobium sp. BG8]